MHPVHILYVEEYVNVYLYVCYIAGGILNRIMDPTSYDTWYRIVFYVFTIEILYDMRYMRIYLVKGFVYTRTCRKIRMYLVAV